MLGGIGIDNYGLYPLALDPLETLKWAQDNMAEGVAFSGLNEEERNKCSPEYLKRLAAYAADNGLYLEWGGGQHIPRDLGNWEKKDLIEVNRKSAEEAKILGVNIVRSCSGGLMRWNPDSLPTNQLMEEMAEALRAQLEMLRDYGIVLAIETHFEFTTFELLKVFEWIGVDPGDCLGICLDTMNLLTMLEDPVPATERVLPWIVSTHIKDGALIMSEMGMQSFTAQFGKGIVDIGAIINLISTLDNKVNLNIEDHGGEFNLPIFESRFLQEFTDLSTTEFVSLLELAGKTNTLLEDGTCRPMPRSDWPIHCEERIKNDLIFLREMVNG